MSHLVQVRGLKQSNKRLSLESLNLHIPMNDSSSVVGRTKTHQGVYVIAERLSSSQGVEGSTLVAEYGSVAQLEERWSPKPKVLGSSPSRSALRPWYING